MKTIRNNKLLGIAVGDKALLVAEVSCSGNRCEVAAAGQFNFGPGQSLQQPEALGQSFGDFLKERGFSTRKAVFGLPAKWILSKSKEVPAADERTVADMLRLQVEGDAMPELKDLVFDFTGHLSQREGAVLLVGTPRKHLDQIAAFAEAARITPVAITASVAALASATNRARKDALVLSLTQSGAELAVQHGGFPSSMRHIGSTSGGGAPLLIGELRRAASSLSRNGHDNGNGLSYGSASTNGNSRRDLVLWDDLDSNNDSGLATCRTAGESAGLNVVDGELSSIGVSATGSSGALRGTAVAVALAAEAIQNRLAIDFLHTRLTPPKEQRVDQRIIIGVAAGVILVALIVAAWWDVHSRQSQLDAIKGRDDAIATRVQDAQAFVAKVDFADKFHADQAHGADCLVELTNLLDNDRLTYVTSFTLHDTRKGVLSGKSQNGASVVSLLQKLNLNKHFHDVELLDDRETTNGVSFSISFVFDVDGKQAAAVTPAPKVGGRPVARPMNK